MRIVLDVEANGLTNPTRIWCIVCKDIDTGTLHIFRNLQTDEAELQRFREFFKRVTLLVGHNLLGYDWPVISKLCDILHDDIYSIACDTLVVSKLVDYSRKGHSLEDYGLEFGYQKLKYTDFSTFREDIIPYCIRDVEITLKVYLKYLKVLRDPMFTKSLDLEHRFTEITNNLSTIGFKFNIAKAKVLLDKVLEELSYLDTKILLEYPKRTKLVREVYPKETKHGTISLSSIPLAIRKAEGNDLSAYSVDAPFSLLSWHNFNPSSHKQLIEVLHQAGWSPVDKTDTHKDTERDVNRLKYNRNRDPGVDKALQDAIVKLQSLQKYGWKINENNLATLPESAPEGPRLLAKRILLESRRRTLTEWLDLVAEDGRIHGKFYGIGAWTHRMAHQNPNTANIPTDAKLYGAEMRALWQAPRNRLLVGVDAEGIQLRIFAHYINDPEFTEALVKGNKDDKTDPHSLNARILGSVCPSRAHAKRFIFAYLLGAGVWKLSEILGCSKQEGEEALNRLVDRYAGLAVLKNDVIPGDANRGWFRGLDGRKVPIPGETAGARKHLAMSGYLQNGEAVVMKMACLKWANRLKEFDAYLVNFVHDEWQTECPNNMSIALEIAKLQADSLRIVGEELNLNCPLAGSYWNDDLKDYTIGTNWKVTH